MEKKQSKEKKIFVLFIKVYFPVKKNVQLGCFQALHTTETEENQISNKLDLTRNKTRPPVKNNQVTSFHLIKFQVQGNLSSLFILSVKLLLDLKMVTSKLATPKHQAHTRCLMKLTHRHLAGLITRCSTSLGSRIKVIYLFHFYFLIGIKSDVC